MNDYSNILLNTFIVVYIFIRFANIFNQFVNIFNLFENIFNWFVTIFNGLMLNTFTTQCSRV